MGEKLPAQAYEIMEARDEDQILAEIQGQILEEMVYSFTVGGRQVTGISWVGIKEIARRYGKIDVDLVELRDSPEVYTVIVKAKDIEKGNGMLGVSTQAKIMQLRNKETQVDQFALQKALSKAQRNAIRALIPETFFTTIFNELKGKEPRKKVNAETKPTASPQGPIKYDVPDKKPKAVDPEVERVSLTLEANDLNEDVDYRHIGNVIRVLPGSGFPRDSKATYDHVLVALMGGKWLSEENRWEVPIG